MSSERLFPQHDQWGSDRTKPRAQPKADKPAGRWAGAGKLEKSGLLQPEPGMWLPGNWHSYANEFQQGPLSIGFINAESFNLVALEPEVHGAEQPFPHQCGMTRMCWAPTIYKGCDGPLEDKDRKRSDLGMLKASLETEQVWKPRLWVLVCAELGLQHMDLGGHNSAHNTTQAHVSSILITSCLSPHILL